jgi:hypothetical protein
MRRRIVNIRIDLYGPADDELADRPTEADRDEAWAALVAAARRVARIDQAMERQEPRSVCDGCEGECQGCPSAAEGGDER